MSKQNIPDQNHITKKPIKTIILDYLGIVAGSFVTALAFQCFLIPNQIAAGGFSGLATILYYLINIPVGFSMLILNIPLFIFSLKMLGKEETAKSLWGTVVLALLIDLWDQLIPLGTLTTDYFLASVYGGLICGLGLGIIFRCQATTGGTELLARLVQQKSRISLGTLVFLIDGVVIVLAALTFNLELALFALIAVYLTGKIIDLLQEGYSGNKSVLIISDYYQTIGTYLLATSNRGITAFYTKGFYTQTAREALLIAVPYWQLQTIKKSVRELDPQAFMIIFNSHEILGEGFQKVN